MKRVDEAFLFGEKAVSVENGRNECLAERKVTRFRIERKRCSGGVFQHVLRFQECHAKFLPAFRRRMPEISGKDDPGAFVKVVDGERESDDKGDRDMHSWMSSKTGAVLESLGYTPK